MNEQDKLDLFAAVALVGIMASPRWKRPKDKTAAEHRKDIARIAYGMAEEMMLQRRIYTQDWRSIYGCR